MFGVKSVAKILKLVYDHVEEEYYDENKVKKEMLELRFDYEMGGMTEEQYIEKEKKLIQRIVDIRERNKQLIEEEEGE
ncbi:MAG: gas vesicle protein GvpG [Bacillota bacterium]